MIPSLETRHCTLCGREADKRLKYEATFTDHDFSGEIFSARRVPDRRHFRFVECDRCHMIYSDPAAAEPLLTSLYAESSVRYGEQEEEIYESYLPILDRAVARLPHRNAFVEIGGGNGFMLRYGQSKGFKTQMEIEPSAEAEARFRPDASSATFVRGMFTRETLPPGAASLICFFQVLDHSADPRAFLESALAALEPAGAAVCVAHDTSAWSARLLGRRSPIFDIQHTYLFNRDNLALLFRSVGFAAVETFPVSNRYRLGYWLRLAPLPLPIKTGLEGALERSKLANRRIRLLAGNLGAIAWKAP